MCLFQQPRMPDLPEPHRPETGLQEEARRRELRRAAGGRASTLLTGPLGAPGGTPAGKRLLGG